MRIFIKSAPGKTVRSPLFPYEPIPAEGYVKPDSPAWRRLERAGDIVIAADKSNKPASK